MVGEPWAPRDLEEDLEGEIHRATPIQQVDRFVEVDVVARGEHERTLGVVARAFELFVTPPLDSI